MSEQWRSIPDHPSYEASDLGRIRRIDGTPVKISYGGWKRSYQFVCLDRKSYAVSRIILRTFRGEPPDGYECRHLNGVHDDNRLANLRWGTHSENIKDQRRHGTWWKTGRQKLVPDDIRKVFELRDKGWTQQRIAYEMGVRQPQISRILNGETWKYLDQPAPPPASVLTSPPWVGVLVFFALAFYATDQFESFLAADYAQKQAAREAKTQWEIQERVRQCRLGLPKTQCEESS